MASALSSQFCAIHELALDEPKWARLDRAETGFATATWDAWINSNACFPRLTAARDGLRAIMRSRTLLKNGSLLTMSARTRRSEKSANRAFEVGFAGGVCDVKGLSDGLGSRSISFN